jgi:hypothetical protein
MHNVICGCLYRRRAVPVMDAFCGCSESQGCIMLCGCLCRRRVVPVMDAFFPSPFLPFCFILLFAFSSSFYFYSRSNQRTLPWHGDQS